MQKLLPILVLMATALAHADNAPLLLTSHKVTPNVTYGVADGHDLKLDIYALRESEAPTPTLVFFHGGGWVGGSKDDSVLALMPYLENGWSAVNVGYRLARKALAPAAAEDAACAVRWVMRNAEFYGFDADRIVLSGFSAGGHLALISGMASTDAQLMRRCPNSLGGGGADRASWQDETYTVAAIVNWAGITDVEDLIRPPNATSYAVAWLGGQADAQQLARRVSPLTYVRSQLPAVITLHGDLDQVVPYDHAVRLHEALDEAGVPNRLHTIAGREHFNFGEEDWQAGFAEIQSFLDEHL